MHTDPCVIDCCMRARSSLAWLAVGERVVPQPLESGEVKARLALLGLECLNDFSGIHDGRWNSL